MHLAACSSFLFPVIDDGQKNRLTPGFLLMVLERLPDRVIITRVVQQLVNTTAMWVSERGVGPTMARTFS